MFDSNRLVLIYYVLLIALWSMFLAGTSYERPIVAIIRIPVAMVAEIWSIVQVIRAATGHKFRPRTKPLVREIIKKANSTNPPTGTKEVF